MNPDRPWDERQTKAALVANTIFKDSREEAERMTGIVLQRAAAANPALLESELVEDLHYNQCGAEDDYTAKGNWYVRLSLMQVLDALADGDLEQLYAACIENLGDQAEEELAHLKREPEEPEFECDVELNDRIHEQEVRIVRAAQPWISRDQIVPLSFALADHVNTDRHYAQLLEAGLTHDQANQVSQGIAANLEELLELGWDYVCDDDWDEGLRLFLDLAQAIGDEETWNLEWATDAALDLAVADHERILNQWRSAGATA